MGEQVIIDSSGILFQYGIAGVVILFESIAIIYLTKENKRLNDERIKDAKEITTGLKEPLTENITLTKSMKELINEILINISRRN